VHVTVGGVLEHSSEQVAENVVVVEGLHCTAAVGALQLTAGGIGTTTRVFSHVPTLPASSVAEQKTTRPLFEYREAIDTLPSALATQLEQLEGQAHDAEIAAAHWSDAVAETTSGAPPQSDCSGAMLQVTLGGTVSATWKTVEHLEVKLVTDDVAMHSMDIPLFA